MSKTILKMMTVDPLWAVSPVFLESFFQMLAEKESLEPQTTFSLDATGESEALYTIENSVAIISVRGMIRRESFSLWGIKFATGTAEIRTAINAALADAKVRGIIFDFYSPGGLASGISDLATEIAQAKQKKPCAAFVDGLCASAAYWLASATGKVYSQASATVGSIGVVMVHTDYSKVNEKFGVSYTYISSGKEKTVGNSDTPLSNEDKKILQAKSDAIYKLFLDDVAKYMNLDKEAASTWADGKDFLGARAKELGLVTEITINRNEAISQLLEDNFMDKHELQAKHPELYAEVFNLGEEKGKTETGTAANDNTQIFALVGAICGDDVKSKLESLANLNISADVLAGLKNAGILASLQGQTEKIEQKNGQTEAQQQEFSSRKNMLDAITQAHQNAVTGTAQNNMTKEQEEQNALERMAKIGVSQ